MRILSVLPFLFITTTVCLITHFVDGHQHPIIHGGTIGLAVSISSFIGFAQGQAAEGRK